MGFIIRSAFWLSLVLLLIPFGAGKDGEQMVNPLQAMFAAKGAIEDIAGMCERKPEVCEVEVHIPYHRARSAGFGPPEPRVEKKRIHNPAARGACWPFFRIKKTREMP